MAFPNTRMLGAGFAPGKAMQLDVEYFDDFITSGYGTTTGHKFASTADVSEWLYTALGGSTATFKVKDDEIGGILAADTGAATDNHGFECQLNGEAFQITADKDIYFECRWASRTTVTALDWIIGLAGTETSILAGPAGNFIGFTAGASYTGAVLDSAAANIIFRSNDDITAWTSTVVGVDTGIDLVAGTYNTMAFWVQMNGSSARVRCYVDGNEKGAFTTVPDAGDPLTLTFACQTNGSVQGIMDIDYIYCAQKR
jgi:hypothetical protein